MQQYLLNNPQVIVMLILGVCTLVVTLIFNFVNWKINHQKMEKELFSEFNKRYDNLNDTLSLLQPDFTLADLKAIKSLTNDNKTLYLTVLDYFNLCGEQYYWHQRGRVSKKIWNSWYAGMMGYYLKYEVLRLVWREETKAEGYKSYYLKKGDYLFEKIEK